METGTVTFGRLHYHHGRMLPASTRLLDGVLPRLEIAAATATARIFLHGAHLTHWQPAHAAAPVLWMSAHSRFEPGKPIRGGVPICFPWFGAHDSDPNAPAHGFARIADWQLTTAIHAPDGTISLSFSLDRDPDASSPWRHRCEAAYTVTIGSRLTMTLEVHNGGREAFAFEEALHSYFTVASVEEVRIDGLEGCEYLDKVASFARTRQALEPIRFHGETDRIYLDTAAACVLHDPGLQRRIRVSKAGSQSTVVWNPWIDKARAMADFGDDEWRRMVCIETANVGASTVRLEPGATHRMTAEIDVEPA